MNNQANAGSTANVPKRRRLKRQEATTESAASNNINFRLDEDALQALQKLADATNLNVHQTGRFLTIAMLQQGAHMGLLIKMLEATISDVRALHESLALAVHTLMISAGDVPPDEAQKWVDDNLKPQC
jgi:hypothetical protein